MNVTIAKHMCKVLCVSINIIIALLIDLLQFDHVYTHIVISLSLMQFDLRHVHINDKTSS